jgi:hypothetical protein
MDKHTTNVACCWAVLLKNNLVINGAEAKLLTATCDIDADTSEVIWEVLFDDGDRADYNYKQLDKILCEGI